LAASFVSNDRLRAVIENTNAHPQIATAIRINTDARLRAIKLGLLLMAALALITIMPAGRLPNYRPGELPSDAPPRKEGKN